MWRYSPHQAWVSHLPEETKERVFVSCFNGDESKDETKVEISKLVIALSGRWGSDKNFHVEEISYDKLNVAYKELCIKSEGLC